MRNLCRLAIILTVILALAGCITETSNVKISLSGTATSETMVGGDVEWNITVKNEGSSDLEELRLSCDYGGLDLLSITPEPVKHTIEAVPEYGELKAGESMTFTFHLIATKAGVAEGMISVMDHEDSVLTPKTVVR